MATGRMYSNLITWLKITLPVGALVILSSLVFVARENEGVRQIPFVAVVGEEISRERVGRPEYVGVTRGGSSLKVVADEATPDPDDPEVYHAEVVRSWLETEAGRVIHVTAPRGRLNMSRELADLLGIVSVDTSDGYHVLTEDLYARTDITYAESGGPVHGTAPFGTVAADRLVIGDGTAESDLIRFTGRVKVIYEPRN